MVDRSNAVGDMQSSSVGNDRTHGVDGAESVTVGGDRTTLLQSNEQHTVGAFRQTTIGANDDLFVTGWRNVRVGVGQNVCVGGPHQQRCADYVSFASATHAFESPSFRVKAPVTTFDASEELLVEAAGCVLSMTSGCLVLSNGCGATVALMGGCVVVLGGNVMVSSGGGSAVAAGGTVGESDPHGDAAELGFEAWSAISAELLQCEPAERADRLEAHDLTPDEWEAADARWTRELAADAAAGTLDRARAYGRACAAERARRRSGGEGCEGADTTGELRQAAARAALPFGGERVEAFGEAPCPHRAPWRSARDPRDETGAVPALRNGNEGPAPPFRTRG